MTDTAPVAGRAWSTLEPEIRSALETRVDKELAVRSYSGAMVYSVVAFILAFSTPIYREHPLLLLGAGIASLLTGSARILSARRVLRDSPDPRIVLVFRSATYASFTVWGIFCAWTVHLYGGEWTSMLLLLCTAALAGGATSSLAPNLPVAVRCLLVLVAPTIVSAASLGGVRHLSLGGFAATYLVFLLSQVKGNSRAFWQASVAAEREKLRGSQERQRAESERASLVAAIEQSTEEILITGQAGEIRYCNLSFEKLSGYTKAEAAGRNLRFLSSGGPHDKSESALAEALLSRGTWSGQVLNCARDGNQYCVEGTISPISNAKGAFAGFVWAAHDVTERLRMEDQLRQAQKMESIGRLAGGVAHDFNNLLTVIKGYAGLLEELGSDQSREYAGLISKAADQGASLTRQLLTFSRKQLINPRHLDLNELVSDLKSMIQRLVGEDIEVRSDLDPHLGLMRGDPDQISQILMNLAANARDAMPEGGTLTVSTWNCESMQMPGDAPGLAGPGVTLAVTDTGVGISPEVEKNIFEPFFTTKERGRGTGLGLSTVYGIVAQSGGQIWVHSAAGRGTTFTMQFPLVKGVAAAAAAGTQATVHAVCSGTVLVVEDHEDLRALIVDELTHAGFRVLSAGNGQEAVAKALQEPAEIHLLVTDVIMPQMNGKEVADRVSAARPAIKVLFISGYSGGLISQHGVLNPDVAYLAKPFSRGTLAAKVRELLDQG